MTLAGRRLTTQQIGAALPDVAPATLYRHLKRLTGAGLITVVARRPVRGVQEKVYMVAEIAALSPDVSGMGPDDWVRAFSAFSASLLGQFESYIRQERADPAADHVIFRTGPLYATEAEAAQLLADLSALVLSAFEREPSPDRRRHLLSLVLVPDVETPHAESEETP